MRVCLRVWLPVCVSVRAEGHPSVKTHQRQSNQGPLKDFSKPFVRLCVPCSTTNLNMTTIWEIKSFISVPSFFFSFYFFRHWTCVFMSSTTSFVLMHVNWLRGTLCYDFIHLCSVFSCLSVKMSFFVLFFNQKSISISYEYKNALTHYDSD